MISNNGIRDNRADVLKGILILCVVFAHSLSMTNSLRNVTWNHSVVNIFFTSFNMPFFSLISGYFISRSLRRRNPKEVLRKRLIRFVPVLLIWCAIPELIEMAANFIHDNSVSLLDVFKSVFNAISGGKLWYIFAYLFCTIWLCTVEFFNMQLKKMTIKVIYQVLACMILLTFIHVFPLSLGYSTFLLPFFYIGYAFEKSNQTYSGTAKRIVQFGCVTFPILLLFYHADCSFYLYSQNIVSQIHRGDSVISIITIYIMRFTLALAGCCFLYELTHYISLESKMGVLLSNIGKSSLEIYILSMYLQELQKLLFGLFVNEYLLNDFTVLFSVGPIFFTLLIFVTYKLKKTINMFPRISKLLLGN